MSFFLSGLKENKDANQFEPYSVELTKNQLRKGGFKLDENSLFQHVIGSKHLKYWLLHLTYKNDVGTVTKEKNFYVTKNVYQDFENYIRSSQ